MLDADHRLRRLLRQIDDFEPAMAEAYRALRPQPARIGPAMHQRISHARKQIALDRRAVEMHETDDATHQSGPLRTCSMT